MTTQEFDYQFDVLYNNIMSNAAPGLDSYEKSVFLTKAQDEIIKSYFNPKGNKYQEGFDDSPKRQYDFSNIIRTTNLSSVRLVEPLNPNSIGYLLPNDFFLSLNEVINSGSKSYSVLPISQEEYFKQITKPYKYPSKNTAWRLISDSSYSNSPISKDYQLGEDSRTTLTITYRGNHNKTICFRTATEDEVDDYGEGVFLASESNGIITIIIGPGEEIGYYLGQKDSIQYLGEVGLDIIYDEQAFMYDAPSTYNTIIILDTFNPETISNNVIEVIGKFNGSISYTMRYIKVPNPIIVDNIDTKETNANERLTINGKYLKTECELPEGLHYEILQRAVELAKIAYIGDVNSSINTGQRSE